MEQLYTPWRMRYLQGQEGERTRCIFCAATHAPDEDRERLVLHRGRHNLVMMNRFPYSNGHVMVAPQSHLGSLTEATAAQLAELVGLAAQSEAILRDVYRPDGLNLGMNLGQGSGAGFADHYHLHVVPRWSGDTNFMTVFAEVRVLPEELGTTYDRLRPHFDRLGAAPGAE